MTRHGLVSFPPNETMKISVSNVMNDIFGRKMCFLKIDMPSEYQFYEAFVDIANSNPDESLLPPAKGNQWSANRKPSSVKIYHLFNDKSYFR